MKDIFIVVIVVSSIIIGASIWIELVTTGTSFSSIGSIYKENESILFFQDHNSSFYYIYSIKGELPYLAIRKIGHFFAFGVLSVIIFAVLRVDNLFLKACATILAVTLIGFFDEIHQHFLMNRSGRILDVIVNAAGSMVAISILMIGSLIIKIVKWWDKGTGTGHRGI